jgi:hypothetical protein
MQSRHAIQAELLPARSIFSLPPVPGVAQLLGLAPVPAFGQPPLRLAVAAIQHKAQKLAIVHGPRCNLRSLHIDTVPGHFIVKRKAAAAMTYAVDARLKWQPCEISIGLHGILLCHPI